MVTRKLIVGLGNPGRSYRDTRHNLGAMVLESLAQELKAELKESRHARAMTAQFLNNDVETILVLPLTFMNLSGQAVAPLAQYYKILPQDILVVCDDIHLQPGELRLKQQGSDGGHNGLRSIIEALGSDGFARLRIGVGEPPSSELQAQYVLGKIPSAQMASIVQSIKDSVECCMLWMRADMARAMTMFNKKKGKTDHEQV